MEKDNIDKLNEQIDSLLNDKIDEKDDDPSHEVIIDRK